MSEGPGGQHQPGDHVSSHRRWAHLEKRLSRNRGEEPWKTGERISGRLEEPGKHLSLPCPWAVAFEMRLEACEDGKKAPGRKNNVSGGPMAGRGLGSYRNGKEAGGGNDE